MINVKMNSIINRYTDNEGEKNMNIHRSVAQKQNGEEAFYSMQ